MARLNLLVLRCGDIDASRRFYELLELRFEKHKHGGGAEHYASEAKVVLELYPAAEGDRDQTGVGFAVNDLQAVRQAMIEARLKPREIVENPWGKSFVVRDPDGRRVEISEEPNPG